ncbi:MAG: esterase family protein [Anaerolineaceae bacterium]|nr:esterase family protein [Anaerolineaceae bacterium]
MKVEEFRWMSKYLNCEMVLRVYGDRGKPVLAFPTENGRYYDLENFGVIRAGESFIESGTIQVFALDSYDAESWLSEKKTPAERALAYDAYVRYIINEVTPFVIQHSKRAPGERMMLMGISMGGYHACNFFFRFPDLFDAVISISGTLHLEQYIGHYMDDMVYFNSPMHYLRNLEDEWYLEKFRESDIIICVGHGQWEDQMIEDALDLQEILKSKDVPCWVDFWGYDVDHDWSWWRKEWPYFLNHLFGEATTTEN